VPEGHTIRRLARTHARHFEGHEIAVSSPQGRFARDAELVDGRVLEDVDAHGKHLFHVYAPDLVVHVHLGLYGRFTQHNGEVTPPRGQVRMRMVAGRTRGGDEPDPADVRWADLRGAITCEVLDEGQVEGVRSRLGPDPLRDDADPEAAWRRIGRSRAPLATLLMDQSVIAGVGNVYRAEVLFRHGLDPQLPGRELGRERFDAVWDDLVALLGDGVRRGGIDTVRDEHRDDGRGRAVYVYRRDGEPCRVCGSPVRRGTHAARNLFWCPHCQA
jgi:endonuclease VIII